MEKKEQMGGIVLAFNDALKTPEWKSTVKESTNYVGSDEAYDAYKPRIYSFNDEVIKRAKKNLPEVPVEIDFIDNAQDMEQTKFGMTMIQKADNIFGGPVEQATVEQAPVEEEINDNVTDNTVKIEPITSYVPETPEYRPVDSFTEAITPVVEETQDEEMEGEVVSFEAEQEKGKVKTLGKRAAYVDTVILCLIAQLSIFGLLIIVLLIIK